MLKYPYSRRNQKQQQASQTKMHQTAAVAWAGKSNTTIAQNEWTNVEQHYGFTSLLPPVFAPTSTLKTTLNQPNPYFGRDRNTVWHPAECGH
jgi:hypothetical protein